MTPKIIPSSPGIWECRLKPVVWGQHHPGQRVPNPHPAKDEALQQARMLLRFAAENAKDIPHNVVSAIATSWEAKDSDRWTAATSSNF
jgi:hypothetical protein